MNGVRIVVQTPGDCFWGLHVGSIRGLAQLAEHVKEFPPLTPIWVHTEPSQGFPTQFWLPAAVLVTLDKCTEAMPPSLCGWKETPAGFNRAMAPAW